MLRRLTRQVRVLAGWLIAIAYLSCVATPALALALGSGPAPCLAGEMEMLPVAVAPAHHDMAAMMDMRAGGQMRGHMAMAMHSQPSGGTAPVGHHRDGKIMPGPCCAMLCIAAVVADLPAITAPMPPAASRIAEAASDITGKAPPLLYRPPIA